MGTWAIIDGALRTGILGVGIFSILDWTSRIVRTGTWRGWVLGVQGWGI